MDKICRDADKQITRRQIAERAREDCRDVAVVDIMKRLSAIYRPQKLIHTLFLFSRKLC